MIWEQQSAVLHTLLSRTIRRGEGMASLTGRHDTDPRGHQIDVPSESGSHTPQWGKITHHLNHLPNPGSSQMRAILQSFPRWRSLHISPKTSSTMLDPHFRPGFGWQHQGHDIQPDFWPFFPTVVSSYERPVCERLFVLLIQKLHHWVGLPA